MSQAEWRHNITSHSVEKISVWCLLDNLPTYANFPSVNKSLHRSSVHEILANLSFLLLKFLKKYNYENYTITLSLNTVVIHDIHSQVFTITVYLKRMKMNEQVKNMLSY